MCCNRVLWCSLVKHIFRLRNWRLIMKKLIIILAILNIFSPLHAVVYHFFNGEKLLEAAMEWEKYQASSRQADLMVVAEYAGYIGAMFDHLSEKQHICAAEGTTKNDVIKVVTDFVKAKNKGLNLSGSVIIEDALYRYYMCK